MITEIEDGTVGQQTQLKPEGETEKKEPTFMAHREFAPVPEEHPEQQRALCMVKGKLLIVDSKKNQGILQVDGNNYPCTFTGRLKPAIMSKRVNQELCFTAWPTGQVPAKKQGQLPLILLQLYSFRRNVDKDRNGFCEIRGIIHTISRQGFQINIHSPKTQETYTLNVHGQCPAKVGDFVVVEGQLTPQGLKLLKCENLNQHSE